MENKSICIINCNATLAYGIARKLTTQKIHCEIFSESEKEKIKRFNPAGIIVAGEGNFTAQNIPVLKVLDENAVLDDFLYKVCRLKAGALFADLIAAGLHALKTCIGDKKVLCALSGGVDSAVVAAMIHKVNPSGLTCVFVDHGLMRKGEAEEVMRIFSTERGMRVIKADAGARFLAKLSAVAEPEKKRKIIGEEFIRVFEEEAAKIGKVDFLAQGTIYPDILESMHGVKTHHNIALPDVVKFEQLIEPLRFLFKDEVRALGLALGLPESMIMRQPFPGPGLGVRVLGEITQEKLSALREADFILRQEISAAGLDKKIWQYFAVLTDMRSVGVTDGKRTYGNTVALRAVHSSDAMSASIAHIPYEVLEKISMRITREVAGVNRVVYDVTDKPPATIEWE